MTALQKKAFWIVVAAQIGVLCFMIGKRTWLLHTGKTVLLKCRPVDPRSLLSGDYVILNFAISNLGDSSRTGKWRALNIFQETFKRHDTIFVALQKPKKSKYWEAVAVSHNPYQLRKKYPVIIRGKLLHTHNYLVRYGVEQYFVPQFAGKKIERKLAQAAVEVALSKSGESAVKRLFIAGKEVTFY